MLKNFIWMLGGFCAAAVGVILWAPSRNKSVEELAHRLEVAWADNHTSL